MTALEIPCPFRPSRIAS